MQTVVVSVVDGGADAAPFLADLVGMVRAVADAGGVPLEEVRSSDVEWVARALPSADLVVALEREVGVHRAQVARPPAGRIATYKVSVIVALARGDANAIIRTYSYPRGRISFHGSGTRAKLAEVLAGAARE